MAMQDGSKFFSNHRLILGVAWAQAGRNYMQDAFSLSLDCNTSDSQIDFFGVFDGHGPNGENISKHVACNLSDVVLGDYLQEQNVTFPESIERGCLSLDADMRRLPELMSADGRVFGGSTACAVWMLDEYIYNGNVGDSRLILSYNGKAYNVSQDHKPSASDEKARIKAFGGYVKNDRVNGSLGVARAFGDYHFKTRGDLTPYQQLVTAVPDVRTVEIEDDIDFLVVASDGVWDIMTNQEVVDFVLLRMTRKMPLNLICEEVITNCTLPINPDTGLGSDNMTIIIAVLRR